MSLKPMQKWWIFCSLLLLASESTRAITRNEIIETLKVCPIFLEPPLGNPDNIDGPNFRRWCAESIALLHYDRGAERGLTRLTWRDKVRPSERDPILMAWIRGGLQHRLGYHIKPIVDYIVRQNETFRNADLPFVYWHPNPARFRQLAILDLDESFVRLVDFVGGDHWFRWASESYVDRQHMSFEELLKQQAELFESVETVPAEKHSVGQFNRLTKWMPTIILTSRGPENEDLTLRTLKKMGMQLAPVSQFSKQEEINERFMRQVEARLGPKIKPVLFRNGIVYGSGQDKGDLALALLEAASFRPERVFFVEDDVNHIIKMQAAFYETQIPLQTILYEPPFKKSATFWNTLRAQRKMLDALRKDREQGRGFIDGRFPSDLRGS
jgi:Protein of unknown function (DUF2608)